MEVQYNLKHGFELLSLTAYSSGLYSCYAEYNDKQSIAHFNVFVMSKGILDVFVSNLLSCVWL